MWEGKRWNFAVKQPWEKIIWFLSFSCRIWNIYSLVACTWIFQNIPVKCEINKKYLCLKPFYLYEKYGFKLIVFDLHVTAPPPPPKKKILLKVKSFILDKNRKGLYQITEVREGLSHCLRTKLKLHQKCGSKGGILSLWCLQEKNMYA